MSEREKREQIGELVETISHIRDESNHIAEKLNRAFYAYDRMTGSSSPHHWAISAGQQDVPVVGNTPPMVENADLSALLNRHELIETLKYQDKLQSELKAAEERLTKLAPHLYLMIHQVFVRGDLFAGDERVMQMVARDGIEPPLAFFRSVDNDSPRRM